MGKTEQLENLAGLGGNLVDTLDADNKGKLGFSWNIERVVGLGLTSKTNNITFLSKIFLDIGFGTLENNFAFFLVFLFISMLLIN